MLSSRIVFLFLVACSGTKVDTDTSTQTDADTDADADTDTDSDGDTDVTTTGDTGTEKGKTAFVGSGLVFEVVGDSPDCFVRWDVASSPASLACPKCNFTLDWQLDVSYTLASSDATGCDPKAKKGADFQASYFYDYSDKWTGILNDYYGWWGHTADANPKYGKAKGPYSAVVMGTPKLVTNYGVVWYYPSSWNAGTGDLTFDSNYFDGMQGSGNVVESPVP
ncbi:MAG: hypothetical protein KTR31_19450 [Myxococcales bacterium]|nr:hypothetical protein [Myxococcales bacterium]